MNRISSYAGLFYPSDKNEIEAMMEKFFSQKNVNPETHHTPLAVIAPHAGYIYSGNISAHSYSVIPRDTEVVIILAPSHRGYFEGAVTPSPGSLTSPLGKINYDGEILAQLHKNKFFSFSDRIDEMEHSHEVQIPFIQYRMECPTVVPVIIGTNQREILTGISDAIYEILKTETRKYSIVISTDLSHYHSYDEACRMDKKFGEILSKYDPNSLDMALESGEIEACGHAPLICGILLTKKLGGTKIELIEYQNSGNTAGDKDRVVGYLSAAIYQ